METFWISLCGDGGLIHRCAEALIGLTRRDVATPVDNRPDPNSASGPAKKLTQAVDAPTGGGRRDSPDVRGNSLGRLEAIGGGRPAGRLVFSSWGLAFVADLPACTLGVTAALKLLLFDYSSSTPSLTTPENRGAVPNWITGPLLPSEAPGPFPYIEPQLFSPASRLEPETAPFSGA
jgi:hypothetical protein